MAGRLKMMADIKKISSCRITPEKALQHDYWGFKKMAIKNRTNNTAITEGYAPKKIAAA